MQIVFFSFNLRFEEDGKYVDISKCNFCPVMKLPSCEADLYVILSASWRKKFKQAVRILHRDHEVKHETISGQKVLARLEEFFEFYQEKKEMYSPRY